MSDLWKATFRCPKTGDIIARIVKADTSDDAMDIVWDRVGGRSIIVRNMGENFRYSGLIWARHPEGVAR